MRGGIGGGAARGVPAAGAVQGSVAVMDEDVAGGSWQAATLLDSSCRSRRCPTPAARRQAAEFLLAGQVTDVCGGLPCVDIPAG